MPLYIDLHIDHTLTPDVIKKCHVADKAIQAKYGVRYLQILLNQPQGYLFCLIEGPSKEACEKVHQEAHGNIACNILEITESDFSALLANKKKDGTDFTLNSDGTLDTGIRALLIINLLGPTEHYQAAKEIIKNLTYHEEGRTAGSFENRLTVIFDSVTSAVAAGLNIRHAIVDSEIPVELRMAVSTGSPLDAEGNFFEAVRRSVDHLSFISGNGQITLSSKVMEAFEGDREPTVEILNVLTPADEKFLTRIMGCIEQVWDKETITMPDFARELGMSKSQLARKLNALTGLSPNDFLKEYRLRKAIILMEEQGLNIAEATLAVGFSSPSYFTKCFRKRFGRVPSAYLTTA